MKKIILLFLIITMFSSCSIMNRTYIHDYSEKIELLERNFPEIYELYCRGAVIIDDVYTYEENGVERVGIHYHYR